MKRSSFTAMCLDNTIKKTSKFLGSFFFLLRKSLSIKVSEMPGKISYDLRKIYLILEQSVKLKVLLFLTKTSIKLQYYENQLLNLLPFVSPLTLRYWISEQLVISAVERQGGKNLPLKNPDLIPVNNFESDVLYSE